MYKCKKLNKYTCMHVNLFSLLESKKNNNNLTTAYLKILS